jgi:hypothetical protein
MLRIVPNISISFSLSELNIYPADFDFSPRNAHLASDSNLLDTSPPKSVSSDTTFSKKYITPDSEMRSASHLRLLRSPYIYHRLSQNFWVYRLLRILTSYSVINQRSSPIKLYLAHFKGKLVTPFI